MNRLQPFRAPEWRRWISSWRHRLFMWEPESRPCPPCWPSSTSCCCWSLGSFRSFLLDRTPVLSPPNSTAGFSLDSAVMEPSRAPVWDWSCPPAGSARSVRRHVTCCVSEGVADDAAHLHDSPKGTACHFYFSFFFFNCNIILFQLYKCTINIVLRSVGKTWC